MDDKSEEAGHGEAGSTVTLDTLSESALQLSAEDRQKLIVLLSGAKPKTLLDNKLGSRGQGELDASQFPRSHQERSGQDDSKVPKLPKFSGSMSKTEPSFRVWKFEVENIRRLYREPEVCRTIHRSVTGLAAEAAMRMCLDANSETILSKFENIFGTVSSSEKLLCDFYSTQQIIGDSSRVVLPT